MAADSADVFSRVEKEQATYLEELREYLRIPSISTDPEYAGEVSRCCDFVVDRLRDAGVSARRLDTGGHPLIYGEWLGAPGAPTVLFYGHYDVQPVDPLDEWRNPPFEPTVEGDHLVARGATDDKGQSYTHIKAVEALLSERAALPVNVKFLLEGEEEAGGESIERHVREDGGAALAADCVVVSDTSMFGPGQPSLLYGLRGIQYMEIFVEGPRRDLHSGTYGGSVANPANALAQILARLQDPETGRILVPGFYDDVRPLSDEERAALAALPFDEDRHRSGVGAPELFGEQGYTTLERAWARPTCDINGIKAGYQGRGAKTVLPARASAKVSMRLVPDQRPDDIAEKFREFIAANAPRGVTATVRAVHGTAAVRLSPHGPFMDAAAAAQEDVWGRPPVLVREGGSIPIVATFAEVLNAPVLMMGFGLPDDGLHSPNEKINISQFYGGIRTIVRLLDRLGQMNGAGA